MPDSFDGVVYEWSFRDSTFHGDDFVSPFSPYETMIFEGIFPNVRQKESMSPEYIQSVEADRVEDERYTKLLYRGVHRNCHNLVYKSSQPILRLHRRVICHMKGNFTGF